MANVGAVKVGDPAPEFALPASDGNVVKLADFLGKSEVVLYFYPKDDTPGCTAEACAFRGQLRGVPGRRGRGDRRQRRFAGVAPRSSPPGISCRSGS